MRQLLKNSIANYLWSTLVWLVETSWVHRDGFSVTLIKILWFYSPNWFPIDFPKSRYHEELHYFCLNVICFGFLLKAQYFISERLSCISILYFGMSLYCVRGFKKAFRKMNKMLICFKEILEGWTLSRIKSLLKNKTKFIVLSEYLLSVQWQAQCFKQSIQKVTIIIKKKQHTTKS